MRLQILLDDEATHRVADHDRRNRKILRDLHDIFDILSHRNAAQRLGRQASAVAAHAQRNGSISLVGEEVQESFIPTPGRMPGAVHEEKWCLATSATGSFVDQLKPLGGPLPGIGPGRRDGATGRPHRVAAACWCREHARNGRRTPEALHPRGLPALPEARHPSRLLHQHAEHQWNDLRGNLGRTILNHFLPLRREDMPLDHGQDKPLLQLQVSVEQHGESVKCLA